LVQLRGALRVSKPLLVLDTVMTTEPHARREKPTLEDYPVVVRIPVFWGDQDLFAHVNNTVYFKWYESARIAYWIESGLDALMKPRGWGPILASVSCDYQQQINFPDTVQVTARISEIRRSSMILDHAVYSTVNQSIAARGRSVVVLFDYAAQNPQRIGEEVRAAIHKVEGRAV
jgi:acyl-CoA thioester hydrolase